MAVQKKCLTLSWAVAPPGADDGPAKRKNPSAQFGLLVAEGPIVRDYLAQTQGKLEEGSGGTDWWDSGRYLDYTGILQKWDGLPKPGTPLPRDIAYPDLLTRRGLLLAFNDLRTALPETYGHGMRHEFYEIKPDSRSGRAAGRRKVRRLRRFYTDQGCPYVPGMTYPRGPRRLPLLAFDDSEATKSFRYLVAIRTKELGCKGIDAWLEVRRPDQEGGVLFYRICVAFDREEPLDDEIAFEAAAHLIRAAVICATAHLPAAQRTELVAATDLLIPVDETEGEEPARDTGRVRRRFKLPRPRFELAECAEAIRGSALSLADAMYSRGVGIPGDEYLLCCDEAFFTNVIVDKRSAQKAVELMQVRASPQFLYFSTGRSMYAIAKPVLDSAAAFAEAGRTAWYHAFPRTRDDPAEMVLTVALVVVAAAGLIAIGGEILLAAEGAALVAPPGAAGGLLMPEAVLAESAGVQAAARFGANAAVRQAARTKGVRVATQTLTRIATEAAKDSPVLEETLEVGEVAKKAAVLGTGITLMVWSNTAYAAPGRNVAAPAPSGKAVGIQLGRLFAIRKGPIGYDLKGLPALYSKFDALRLDADAPPFLDPRGGPRPTLDARYVGRVVLK